MAFSNSVDQDETAHNEPSHQDLRCLTFSLSTLYIKVFLIGSLIKKKKKKKKKKDFKSRLKFAPKVLKKRDSLILAKNEPFIGLNTTR